MSIKHLSDLMLLIKNQPIRKMVMVNGVDAHSIDAAEQARKLNIAEVIITGDKNHIEQTCVELGVNIANFKIIAAKNSTDAAQIAAKIANNGEADFLVKGLLNSDQFMRAILNKELGLVAPKSVLSHVTIIENKAYHKLLIVSDVAVIPFPTLSQKQAIIKYLIQIANKLDIFMPKIALIAPTEQIVESIPACVDAAKIKIMTSQQTDAFIDGPMALDVALDKESAAIKQISSKVAGDADCLLFPNIDAGNVFYKTNTKLCHSKQAAVVIGAKIPAVLSSRGDSVKTKLNSIILAALMCE